MGVDCKIKVGNKYTSLDRWYVFSPRIRSSVEMTYKEALTEIRNLKRKRKLITETNSWGDRQEEKINYHTHWLLEARRAIKEGSKDDKVIFYADHDVPDEYYSLYT